MSGHKNTTKPPHKDQRTSSRRHWNQCELVIHLKKTNKNKEDNFFPNGFFPNGAHPGRQWQGARQDPTWRGRPSMAGPISPAAPQKGTCPRTSALHVPIFGTWEDTRVQGGKPRRDGRTCELHTVRPAENLFFFRLISDTMKQGWRKQCYSRTFCSFKW